MGRGACGGPDPNPRGLTLITRGVGRFCFPKGFRVGLENREGLSWSVEGAGSQDGVGEISGWSAGRGEMRWGSWQRGAGFGLTSPRP